MTKQVQLPRIETGVRNLDALLCGGLPQGSATVIAGSPGAGKTILAQQICFHNAALGKGALCFSTLSEPTAKTLLHLSQFSFFDPKRMNENIQFVDLGGLLRGRRAEEAIELVMDHVRRKKPSLVMIDSFKVFNDLTESSEELRAFGYELAVQLMAWETTVLLLGEFGLAEIATNPLFSIVDGLLLVNQREQSGEQQRFIQIVKMRGTDHSRDEHPFLIGTQGIEIFAPRVTIKREENGAQLTRCKTGISKLDDLLGEGIPRGSSLLVAGVAGTGKTVLLLEFIYRGALAGEKGVIFSFEETGERLRSAAASLGWDFEGQIERGMIELVFIPQPDILVEQHMLMMRDRIHDARAQRVAVDSVSVFLHKIKDSQTSREKTFQLASIVQNARAVGLFATDIPYGANQISRFGVEETVVDGVILLTSTQEGFERQRYLEVYKLRNTAHSKGRHNIVIGPGGVNVFPRYASSAVGAEKATRETGAARRTSRLASGIPGLDPLLGGGFHPESVTLICGTAGTGKTTAALQFVIEGAAQNEPGLYIALEESREDILRTATELDMPLESAMERGLVDIVALSREHVRANQLLTILGEKIRAGGTRRLSFDSASCLCTEGLTPLDARHALRGLIMTFKQHEVTSCFTLELDESTDRGLHRQRSLSSLADNLLLLRASEMGGERKPTLTVIKTRASPHDFGTHDVTFGRGGLRIVADGEPPSHRTKHEPPRRASKKPRAKRSRGRR